MIIYIPYGSDTDFTRMSRFYEETWNYLKEIGIEELHQNKKEYQRFEYLET
jgi:hypothetical protein